MSLADAYLDLGLAPDASAAEVKAAWRRLVSRWHPDRNAAPDAADRVQRINAAYAFIVAAQGGDAPAAEPQASPRRRVQRRVRLSIEELAFGGLRTLRGRLVDACGPCAGRGCLPDTMDCSACAGRGQRPVAHWFGWLPGWLPCEACEGRGSLQPRCADCGGSGQQVLRYRCALHLPAGVRVGDVLHAEGHTEPPASQALGFELRVEMARHAHFTLDGQGRLCCELAVDGWAWLAEAWIDVPALQGRHSMRLRRGRLVYRLPGQGLPRGPEAAQRDDYLVTVRPTFPERLSPRQQALLDQLVDASA